MSYITGKKALILKIRHNKEFIIGVKRKLVYEQYKILCEYAGIDSKSKYEMDKKSL